MACDIQIAASSTSRQHALIQREGDRLILRDLDSRNGVFVDGRQVNTQELAVGNVIRIGGGVGVVIEESRDGEAFGELAAGLWGGPTLSRTAEKARAAAQSSLHIILEAESGSGKERFARAIHEWSGRAGAFVALNCAAIPSSLAEAELFGYQRGAFTGADRNQTGFFKAAANGTLFLDEILELPASIQAKLLRAVEMREVIPLGATLATPVATRVVCACQTPIAMAARDGHVRPDLFARLNGVTITIPPLRDRREDIFPLFQMFLHEVTSHPRAQLHPAAIEALCLHDWPLNVRELETVARRVPVFHPGDRELCVHDIRGLIGKEPVRAPDVVGEQDLHWQRFVEALTIKRGNVVRAAEAIGISRQRAYRLIAQHPELNVAELRKAERCRP